MYLVDCCTLKDSADGQTVCKTWRLMVNYPSEFKITDMFSSKAAMVEPTAIKLSKMKQHGILPKYLRMDNAGENKVLKTLIESKEYQLPINVELTPHDTPQMNLPVEVAFPSLGGRAHAMMTGAHVPKEQRKALMPEAVKCAMDLDRLITKTINGVTKS
jgi:hypothetical protein